MPVSARVPILLIHGLADNETSPENSMRIARANPEVSPRYGSCPERNIPAPLHIGSKKSL